MPQKRIIFSLLYFQGNFVLSRNFRRQKVGNYDWLVRSYNLLETLTSLDELVLINLDRNDDSFNELLSITKKLSMIASLPITVGGGINSALKAHMAFNSGADKVMINSYFFDSASDFTEIGKKYGSQAVVLNIDYRIIDGERIVFSHGGTMNQGPLRYILDNLNTKYFGELFLRNIDKDGTGFGNDIGVLEYFNKFNRPLLLGGGTGKSDHVVEAFNFECVDGIVTANILNFIGSGIVDLRNNVSDQFDLAKW